MSDIGHFLMNGLLVEDILYLSGHLLICILLVEDTLQSQWSSPNKHSIGGRQKKNLKYIIIKISLKQGFAITKYSIQHIEQS